MFLVQLCKNNNLKNLEHCSKQINGYFNCKNNPELKNIKEQIIKYQIKAEKYLTDEGDFDFETIKKEFFNKKSYDEITTVLN